MCEGTDVEVRFQGSAGSAISPQLADQFLRPDVDILKTDVAAGPFPVDRKIAFGYSPSNRSMKDSRSDAEEEGGKSRLPVNLAGARIEILHGLIEGDRFSRRVIRVRPLMRTSPRSTRRRTS